MAVELAGELLRVAHREAGRAGLQVAGVADLAAAFGVERGAVEDHHGLVAGLDQLHRTAVLEQGQYFEAVGRKLVVAQELGRCELRGHLGRHRGGVAELAGGTRGFALLFHRCVETVHVHRQAALARDVGGQVDREAIGVVQTERVGTGNDAFAARCDFVEDAHAGIECLGETLFLGQQRALDELALGRQFRVGIAHHLGQRRDHAAEEWALLARASNRGAGRGG